MALRGNEFLRYGVAKAQTPNDKGCPLVASNFGSSKEPASPSETRDNRI
jgi:hypothetical protein